MLLEKFLVILFSDLSIMIVEASLEIPVGRKFILFQAACGSQRRLGWGQTTFPV